MSHNSFRWLRFGAAICLYLTGLFTVPMYNLDSGWLIPNLIIAMILFFVIGCADGNWNQGKP
jgi:hypothetical protein